MEPPSLIPCRECRNPVSSAARSCPKCGAPQPALAKLTGTGFEWKSRQTVCGWPLVHVAFGREASGKFRVAKGVLAIGQFGIGLFTIAQIGVGFLFGFGQVMVGLTAIAQVAVTVLFGIGQFASGFAAVGQVVLAFYGLGQVGLAAHLWSMNAKDPEAARFFTDLAAKIGLNIGHWFHASG
jgi:hypothetical protein